MKFRSIFLSAVLVVAGTSLASAKSYDVFLSGPTKAGSVQLKAGQYRLTIEGTKATFHDEESGKSYTTDVKIENNSSKFDSTRMETSKEAGADVLKDIQLGGSNTQVDF
jgi:lipopolysaccharide export system protein LptA